MGMIRWILVSLVVLVLGFFVFVDIYNTPPENLGVENGLFASCPNSPNCVSTQADPTDTIHYVEPIVYRGSMKDAQLKIEQYFLSKGDAHIVESRLGYLYLEKSSDLFGFIDDVEFYFPEADSVIHVRSASRVGYDDLGVNTTRVRQVRELLVN
ncbi:DUF1499 domain-containing protein [Marinomonas balearica]|uniref:Uncharacterized protein (DUF1499 family) n=1 Tax=Marinomonas balearica TaxID=491947 RepID=A0A4R6M5T1_9GAMM|nr:DUF1499 domain-containing protein [Marinomonas balearica]TDO96446.1 uncharacterized protein (DUF1499 family) [Marinomonas balearica]